MDGTTNANLSPINRIEEDGVERARRHRDARARRNAAPSVGGDRLDGPGRRGSARPRHARGSDAAGFYQHDDDASWKPFRPFPARVNRDMRDPNFRLVDLDGDGRADVLVTEDDVLTWYPSLGEEGFAAALQVAKPQDEDAGPALVFADGTQSIYLADMSGDGLSDLVRFAMARSVIGQTSATDSSAPRSRWTMRRGSTRQSCSISGGFVSPISTAPGTTDIMYLTRDGVRLFFNQSGNQSVRRSRLPQFPRTDTPGCQDVDLLGIGTTCLVWSSPLPADARHADAIHRPDGRQKPHLLSRMRTISAARRRSSTRRRRSSTWKTNSPARHG